MLQVIACDDNRDFLKLLVSILGEYEEVYNYELKEFQDGKELLEYCKTNPFDIVYMDIEIGTSNGMDLARTLKKINPKSLTIYISAYDTYYVRMANAEPFRFILKNLQDIYKFKLELVDTLDAAYRRVKGKDIWTYFYKNEQYKIEFNKIKYFFSFARKVYIISTEELEQDFFYGKIDDIQEILEESDDRFVRINNRTIVNLTFTRMKGRKKAVIGNKEFTVSPEYKENFKERGSKYWGRYWRIL